MIEYATAQDLERYTGQDAPEGVGRLLREASALVRGATRNDRYATIPSGLPSDDDLAEAMRDATCAQVEFWGIAGVSPGAEVGAAPVSRTSVDSASVDYDTSAQASVTAMNARIAAANRLCSSSYAILRNAGLASA